MNRFEKAAYGGSFDEGEYDRWVDGGPAWGLDKQKMIDLTRLFAEEAAKRKATLQFYSGKYSPDMYSPDEAIKRISASKDPNDFDDDTLPNYYNLEYPRKPRSGILEHLRLKTPDYITDWGPEGHPMEAVNKALSPLSSIKKAAETTTRIKLAEQFGKTIGQAAGNSAVNQRGNGNLMKQPPKFKSDIWDLDSTDRYPEFLSGLVSDISTAKSQLKGNSPPPGFISTGNKGNFQYTTKRNPNWRSAPVSSKVNDMQNMKHYEEAANTNRANLPYDHPFRFPAIRATVNDRYKDNAWSLLPFLFKVN